MGLLGRAVDMNVDAAQTILDVPADAINATTGTGKNLGWFGVIDRKLDPRQVESDQWADPSAATTGLSGFFAGGLGATTALGENVGKVTTEPVLAGLGLSGSGSQKDGNNDGKDDGGQGTGLILLVLAGVAALALGVLR